MGIVTSYHQASGGAPSEQKAYSGFLTPWSRLHEDSQPMSRFGLLTSQADEAPPWGSHSSPLSPLLCGLQSPLWCTEHLLVYEIPGFGTQPHPLYPRFSPTPSWCWEWITRGLSWSELSSESLATRPFVRFLAPNTRAQLHRTIGLLFCGSQDGGSQGQFLLSSLPESHVSLPGGRWW